MTIETLLQRLQAYVVGQRLTIPKANTLESPAIDALLGNAALYPGGSLVFDIAAGTSLAVVAGAIPATGVFLQAFLGQSSPGSTLLFTIVSGVAQLQQNVNLPATWTFPDSFPALDGGALVGATFTSPSFVLVSATNDRWQSGLNFTGTPVLKSPGFAPLGWLWTSGKPVVGGVMLPVDMAKGVPTMTLVADESPTTLVWPGVSYTAGLTVASDATKAPTGTLGVNSTLALGGGLPALTLVGTWDGNTPTLATSMTDKPTRITNLDQLVALAGGSSLANLIPSQFSLGDLLVLAGIDLQLVTDPSGGVASVGMTVALEVEWELVPSLVTLDEIRLGFVVLAPVSLSPSLTAGIDGRFTLTNPRDPEDVAEVSLGVLLPALVFSGSLVSGQIDLVGATAHFFGDVPALDGLLPLVALDFTVDVSNRTYSLDRATVKPSESLALRLGTDLPESVSVLKLEEITLSLLRSPTVFQATISALVSLLGAEWNISAAYSGSGGWVFAAALVRKWPLLDLIQGPNAIVPASWNLSLPKQLVRADIDALAFTFDAGANTFVFDGAASLELDLSPLKFTIAAAMHLESNRPGGKTAPAQYTGSVRGTLTLDDIALTVVYAFRPNNTAITFVFNAITGTYDTNDGNPYVRVAFGDTSVGGILEFLIGLGGLGPAKLSAPWNVLNAISLNGLQITIFLNTKAISVVYPINLDLGFVKINKITFDYKKVYGQSEIVLSLDATFLGQSYPALAWNPVTQSPPAVPGAGAAVFDLQYLALGQHVSLRNTDPSKPLDTVSKVITALRGALTPVPNPKGNPLTQLPGLAFDAGSNWLIGAQFTIAGTFSMSLVFNDPNVYGLLISLAGEKAGIFAGLQFEILYRKITDEIGVYHVELKLPDVMRRLQFGAVTITLPVVAIDIYTNGDFRIDMGFPTSLTDFSRSFALEVFPFTGAGGFYFAKLSGDTSLKVPMIDNGRFSTVIEFGIALAVGLGKSLSLGILSGGISITVRGMVQGVYASFEPTSSNVPSATFFSLQGTVAIVGQVYATVDFGIIQASVSLTVYAQVALAVQTYEPIFIEISAGVSVSVSIKIVFFRISFSFSATIRESFTIGSRSTPPWHVIGGGGGTNPGALTAGADRRLLGSGGRRMSSRGLRGRGTNPRVRGLRAGRTVPAAFLAAASAATSTKEPVTIYATPVVTKALDTDLTVPAKADGGTEVVALSALLMIDSAVEPGKESDFTRLLGRVLRWTIATFGDGYPTVTATELAALATTLRQEATFTDGFSSDNLDAFMSANVEVTLAARPTTSDGTTLQDVAFFPMCAALSLKTPNYTFDFGTERTMSPTDEAALARYFAALQAQYANAVENNPTGAPDTVRAQPADEKKESPAAFLFRRWFLLLAQGAVQAASDLLERYQYPVNTAAEATLASIAAKFGTVTMTHVTTAGDTLASLAKDYDALPTAIEAANPTVDFNNLAPGTTIVIPIQVFVAYLTRLGDTPASVSDEFGTSVAELEAANPGVTFGSPTTALPPGTSLRVPVGVTVHTIVAANATTTGLLRTWPAAQTPAAAAGSPERPVFRDVVYQVVDGDSIESVGKRFATAPATIVAENGTHPIFRPGGSLALGDLVYTSRPGDSLQSVASFYGYRDVAVLLAGNTPGIPLAAQSMIIPGNAETLPLEAGTTLEAFATANKTTTAELLVVNAAILVVPGTNVNLPQATYATTGATIPLTYVGATGETLNDLASRFYSADTQENRDAIVHANPMVTFPLTAPTAVSLAAPETADNILGTFELPAQTFTSAANVGNTALLAPRTPLVIPPLSPAITATDTFQSLAEGYGLTLDAVADALAETVGLFRDADPSLPVLTIPYVPALGLDDLVASVTLSPSANQTAAMASRFLLAGLRVPNPADPKFQEDPQDPSLVTYPLLSLSGQEFAAPTPADAPTYTLAFTKTGAASWLTVPGGTLTLPLAADEVAQVTEFAGLSVAPNVIRCERIALSANVRDGRTLQTSFRWRAGTRPTLPADDASAGEPTLWTLPDALLDDVARIAPSGVPYEIMATTPTPAGAPEQSVLASARWAVSVPVRITRVPSQTSDGPNLPGSFLVVGADQDGTATLLDLVKLLDPTEGRGATLSLLYVDPSDSTGGTLLSDAVDPAGVVLLKTNLSTLSNASPVQSQWALLAAPAPTDVYSATFAPADSAAFVRLLWECSVVKSGGFYLSYAATDGTSLPDAIFGVGGEAVVTFVALLDQQPGTETSLLLGVNNAIVIGANIDTGRTTLAARAGAHTVVAGDTLTTVATTFTLLNPRPTPASLALANADVHRLLDPTKTILVKGVVTVIGSLDTFGTIARAAGIDPGALGTENAMRDILQTGALVQPLAGMIRPAATLRPGNTGFFVTRTDPQQADGAARALGAADGQAELDTLFNLLGFTITANAFFSASGQGLPAQPTHEEGDPLWNYRQALNAAAFALPNALTQVVPASSALPPPCENPYAGVAAGAVLDVRLGFRDVHGNKPGLADLAPTVPVGYTDDLLGLATWPSTASAFSFVATKAGAELVFDVRFSAAPYMPGPGADYEVTHDKARVDRQQVIAAYYQSRMPDVGFAVDTTVATLDDPDAAATDLRLAAQAYLMQAYVFLTAAAALPPVTNTTASGDTLVSVATAFETTAGLLAQANASADAVGLFGARAPLNIPKYYRVATGDTLDSIVNVLLPNGTPAQKDALVAVIGTANAAMPLLAGTALVAKARAVTIDARDGHLANLSAIANSQDVVLSSNPVIGIVGLAAANTAATLGTAIDLAYPGAPNFTTGTATTLAEAVATFAKTIPDASADGVAQTNRLVQRFFADGDVVSLPNYVAQPGDTLAAVASRVGTVSGSSAPAQTALENRKIPDVFPPGTPLFWGLDTYLVQPGDTLQSVADSFAVTVEDLGLRNGTVLLASDRTLRIPFLVDASPVATSTYRADGTESIAGVLERYSAWSGDRTAALADYTALNRYVAGQFSTAAPIVIGGQSHGATLTSTVDTLATLFGLSPVAFVTAVADTTSILRAGAIVLAPSMTASAAETLEAVATRYQTTVDDLADANASVYGLVAAGQTVSAGGYAVMTGDAETFTTLAARLNAARAAAGFPAWLAASDVALANPKMTLRAATLVPPVRDADVRVPVTAKYDAAIAPITVTVTQTRAETLVDPEFKSAPAVFRSTTPVAPQLSSTAAAAQGAGDDPLLSLGVFAADFEAAFPGLKVATGPENDTLDSQRAACGTVVSKANALSATAGQGTDPLANRRLWAVNFGSQGDAKTRFNYSVDRTNPAFYAYPPLSTALWDSGDVTVMSYVSGVGLSGSQVHRFQAVEPDLWARSFLETFDALLAPAAAVALRALPPVGGVAPLDALLKTKDELAGLLRDELTSIFATSGDGAVEAQERFYQQLLVELSAAYADDVLVQYPFTVTSGCTDTAVAARLSGKPLAATLRTPATGIVDVPGLAALAGVSLPYFETAIATMHFLVAPGLATKLGERTYTTGNDDTLTSLATIYQVTVPEVVERLTVETPDAGLLRNDAVVNLTRICRAPGSANLTTLATAMGGTVVDLVAANADLAQVFLTGSSVTLPGKPVTPVPAAGSFSSVASALGLGLDALADALWNADVTQAPNAYALTAATVLTLLAVPPPYSFTTAKVPLAAGTSHMTSIFSVKNAALERSVFLHLRYAVTEMEFDIVQDPDAFGEYQSSSWLTFVIPIVADDVSSPNDANLGLVQLPVPLRAYPQPFVLGGAGQDESKVDSIFEWTYGFDAARVMAPQDTAGLVVGFNVPEQSGAVSLAAAPRKRDVLFKALAQFAFVQGPLKTDLASLGAANPTPDETKRSAAAVTAFVTIAQAIEGAWRTPVAALAAFPDDGDIYTFRLQTIPQESDPSRYRYLLLDKPTGPPDFAFTLPLATVPVLKPGPVDPALAAAFAKEGYALSPGAVLAQAPPPPAGAWTLTDAANDRTYLLVVTANDIVVARKWLWPTVFDTDGKAYPAQQIGDSSLVEIEAAVDETLRVRLAFERIQVVGKQNAVAGMSVTRNANLVAGRTTVDAFVYATPLIVLAGTTTPNVVVGEPVDLRASSPTADLAASLGAFCDEVFASQIAVDPKSTRTVAVEATYAYAVGPDNPVPVRFPLALVPNYAYVVGTDGDPSSATSFVSRFATFVSEQAAAAGVPSGVGAFAFRFTVFSTLAGGSGARPILRYDDLVYARTVTSTANDGDLQRHS